MTKIKVMTCEAEESIGILKVEEVMRHYGIQIMGCHLRLHIKNQIYKIGRDADAFPRMVEERLELMEN